MSDDRSKTQADIDRRAKELRESLSELLVVVVILFLVLWSIIHG